MAVYRTYECPSCTKTFDFLHHPNDEPPPSFCPLCGTDVSGKKKKSKAKKVDRVNSPGLSERVKRMPSVRRTASRSADAVYRGMENATNARIQAAAETLGVDTGSLNAMKMTDMKDNLREGDMAQSTSAADATQLTGSAPMAGNTAGGTVSGVGFNQNASEYARSTGTGPSPYAGNAAREMVNSLHSAKGNSVVSAGRINKK